MKTACLVFKKSLLAFLGVILLANFSTNSAFAYPYTGGSTNYTTGANTQPYGLVVIDFNGDDYKDLATSNLTASSVSVLINDGDGTFASPVQYGVGTNPRAIVSGDFDKDGKTDLATANATTSNVSVLIGNGDGTFDAAVNYTIDSTPWSINR